MMERKLSEKHFQSSILPSKRGSLIVGNLTRVSELIVPVAIATRSRISVCLASMAVKASFPFADLPDVEAVGTPSCTSRSNLNVLLIRFAVEAIV